MFGSIPFPVPAAEVERGMSCEGISILVVLADGREVSFAGFTVE